MRLISFPGFPLRINAQRFTATYHLRIYAEGIPGTQSGWVIDFGEIKESVHLILEQLDQT